MSKVAISVYREGHPVVHQLAYEVRRSHEQIIDTTNPDALLFAGFDAQKEENADRVIQTFHEFIEENKDEIIALRILYSQTYQDRPMVLEKLKAVDAVAYIRYASVYKNFDDLKRFITEIKQIDKK